VAEWLCSGLQSRGRRFDSDLSLHFDSHTTSKKAKKPAFERAFLLPACPIPSNRTAHLSERHKMMQEWADCLDKLKAGAEIIPIYQSA
jgi:hypothetical protein